MRALYLLLAVKLTVGAALPSFTAKTLNDEPAGLPADAMGRPAMIVIGFTKAAATAVRPWLERCLSAHGPVCYDVRMVESIPHAFRGMAEKGMLKGYPENLRKQALLVYTDNAAWRERVGVTDDKTAYVVAVDAEGIVRGLATGPLTDGEFDRLIKTAAK